MTIWFTSDEHLDHRNIVHFCNRPFSSVEEMRETIIANHNSVVKPDDEVRHLGDFAFNEKTVAQVLPRLNGTHYLVRGNHDRCFPTHKGWEEATKRYLGYGFKEIVQETQVDMFRCHHMPYEGDSRHEARYAEWRPEDRGDWLLHGHCHGAWAINGRQIDVGVDVWNYTPVSLETLIALTKDPFLAIKCILPKMRPEVQPLPKWKS